MKKKLSKAKKSLRLQPANSTGARYLPENVENELIKMEITTITEGAFDNAIPKAIPRDLDAICNVLYKAWESVLMDPVRADA